MHLCVPLAASLAAVANPIINDCWISYCFVFSNSTSHSVVYMVTTREIESCSFSVFDLQVGFVQPHIYRTLKFRGCWLSG